MFGFFRRQKTTDSDKNGKSDKEKKEIKTKEKYTSGLSSPSTSAKRRLDQVKQKSIDKCSDDIVMADDMSSTTSEEVVKQEAVAPVKPPRLQTPTPLQALTASTISTLLTATPTTAKKHNDVDNRTDSWNGLAQVSSKTSSKRTEDLEKERDEWLLEKQSFRCISTIVRRNLVSQETRFQEQLAELKAQLEAKDTESNQLCYRIEELQRDVFVRTSGMDRLEAELVAANKESQCVRQKLRLLENDVADYRQKNVELSDELLKKSDEVAKVEGSSSERVVQLEATVKAMEEKLTALQAKLEEVTLERDQLAEEIAEMEAEREEERTIVQEALEEVNEERTEIQTKFERDFEKLRTVNTDREQQLLNDFEWKLREVEQANKRRLEEKDKKCEEKVKNAHKELEAKIKEAEKQLAEAQQLKSKAAEADHLKSLHHEQQKSLRQATRQTEQLQVSEMILKEEVSLLRSTVEKEKSSAASLHSSNEKKISELEKKLHSRLELQKTELNDQWESRLRRECGRLKAELDQLHVEEKRLAIESIKIQKEQETQLNKQNWERRLQESLKEISTLKDRMTEKDAYYQKEIERAQTNADRDILELRRKLDKMDMGYQGQIEKLKENHEKDLEQLNWESTRKIQQLEQSWQIQTSSTRTTLELVKEQMERDGQTRLEAAESTYRMQLEQQWERLTQEKEEEMQILEENHLKHLQRVRAEFETTLNGLKTKENELLMKQSGLQEQLTTHSTVMTNLRGNADSLQGNVDKMSQELTLQSKEMIRVQQESSLKLKEREAEMEAERRSQLVELAELCKEEARLRQAQFNTVHDQMSQRIISLTRRLEESIGKNEPRSPRPEDVEMIGELRRIITEQERDLLAITEEKRFYEQELSNRDVKFVLNPTQYAHGPKKKGGGRKIPLAKSASGPSQSVIAAASTGTVPKPDRVIAAQIARSRSMDYPTIRVPAKSPIRKAKKPPNGSQSITISTL